MDPESKTNLVDIENKTNLTKEEDLREIIDLVSDSSIQKTKQDEQVEKQNTHQRDSSRCEKNKFSVTALKSLLSSVPVDSLYCLGNKLNVLIPLVQQLLIEKHHILIFAHSLKMLYIIESCLNRSGVSCLTFNGHLNTTQRTSVLEAFRKQASGVLLITIGAGGEGITIIEATRIIITDPSWNPTVDDQAISRA